MEFKKIIKILLTIVITLALILLGITLYNKYTKNDNNIVDEGHALIPKKYQVNEYSLVNIDDKQIANIYLIDYRNELIENREIAYKHLNGEYRIAKFNSIDEFNDVINNYNIINIYLKKYAFSEDRKFLKVYFSDIDSFIFKINGILDYEVYLDDTTVEMR